ncbi:MAG: xanthine dehydrogenase family protein subunit M, partial [Terriglobia bacterium]
ASIGLTDDGRLEPIAIGVTGVGPKAYRATAIEEALRGRTPSASLLAAASEHAVDGVEVNSDLYASAGYRSHLAKVYTRRALEKALERTSAT